MNTRFFWQHVSLVVLVIAVVPVQAMSLKDQRLLYQKAKLNLAAGHSKTFLLQAEQLKDYPLYPYLEFQYLKRYLHQVKTNAMERFFHRYDDLPAAEQLRVRWLKLLVTREDWNNYLHFYHAQNDPLLNCYHLHARMKTGKTTYLLEDIRSAWLVGESMPKACDSVFELLYQSDLMDSALVWQRISLAMENQKISLANYLGRLLPDDKKMWQQRWIQMHDNPLKWTHKPSYVDIPEARQILIYGIKKLTHNSIEQAIARWRYLEKNYNFLPGEVRSVERQLAIRAAQKNQPSAEQLLDQIDISDVDNEILRWRIHTALKQQNWQLLLKWTHSVPPHQTLANPWWYWHGRALEAMGKRTAAKYAWKRIATQRDYYGFMAADRLGWRYRMNHFPLPAALLEKQKLNELPAIKRAYELRSIGLMKQSRHEWMYAVNRMSRLQMQIAATLAQEWGWHFETIATLGKAKMRDDLILRFPLTHRELLTQYANKRQLDIAWIYGLVRAESAFVEDAQSPVGALGLMQVMPATGKEVAQTLGIKKFNKELLLKAETNIPIGSHYLKQMLVRFDNNVAMATAAYNAGPYRVTRWRPQQRCIDTDIWIELIPFKETRDYVKRVLSYASIYDWRLEQEPVQSLSERLGVITPTMNTLNCSAMQISQQIGT